MPPCRRRSTGACPLLVAPTCRGCAARRESRLSSPRGAQPHDKSSSRSAHGVSAAPPGARSTARKVVCSWLHLSAAGNGKTTPELRRCKATPCRIAVRPPPASGSKSVRRAGVRTSRSRLRRPRPLSPDPYRQRGPAPVRSGDHPGGDHPPGAGASRSWLRSRHAPRDSLCPAAPQRQTVLRSPR